MLHCSLFSSVQFSCSDLSDSATPWIAACQASLSITNSRSLLKLMSIKSAMPSSHLILCSPLLLLPPIPPIILDVFKNRFFFKQYCDGFCSASTRIGHRHTYVPSFLNPPLCPPYLSRSSQSTGSGCPASYIACFHWLSVLQMAIYVPVLLFQITPPYLFFQ